MQYTIKVYSIGLWENIMSSYIGLYKYRLHRPSFLQKLLLREHSTIELEFVCRLQLLQVVPL